jgi:hypothetical protein
VLCAALNISPVDLLVPAYLDDLHEYQFTSNMSGFAGNVREWIRGEYPLTAFVGVPVDDPDDLDYPVTPVRFRATDIAAFTEFMPEDRSRRVLRRYVNKLEDEEADQ